jgi:hypothetical protein
MKEKILAGIAPSVHPTKVILRVQGLIKSVTGFSFTEFEGGLPYACRGNADADR